MKYTLGLVLCVAACGPAPRDEALMEDFLAINEQYKTLSGKDLPTNFGFEVDDREIERRRKETGKGVGGIFEEFSRVVTMPSKGWWDERYDAPFYRAVFAHEIGHAIGLDHAQSGLMMLAGDRSCIGREGQCLFEAIMAAPL